MKPQEPLDPTLARAEGFRLLSECFCPPDAGLEALSDQLSGCLEPLCPDAGPYVEAMQAEVAGEKDVTPWRVDYARLFLGPFGVLAPPYGSVYLDGGKRLMGDTTLWVQERYRQANVDVSDGFHDALDHVTVELEFMHYLSFKQAEAEAAGDREAALHFARKQEDFLEQHLGAWLCEFTDRIKLHAQTGWYRNLAEITRLFIVSPRAGVPKDSGPFRT